MTASIREGSGPPDGASFDAQDTAVSKPWHRRVGYLLLAALAYLPVLAAHPGRVVADTKQYLYLDPGRVLERAWSMWDGNIGLGTVTHQNIGYLFPMGPYYWVLDRVGVPDWVAQRLWLATILFAAGTGILYLFRTLGLRGAGAPVGALVFMLSPYWLEYAARLSVLLLPWAGLPWMLAFLIRGLRRGGWRHAALFALLIQVIGSVNLTALVFAGLAPLLWIPYALVIERVDWRRVLGIVAKIGLLTLTASAWWMSGLWAQGGYGLNILKYTETMRVVSRTTMPNEVLRGLGYWFFYGRDRLGPWIEASTGYTQRPLLILVSYAIPTLALLSAAIVRWRYRAYFMLVIVVGVVVAVGAHPYDSPTPVGAAFKKLSQTSSVAFALRSTGRAVPLVVLGLAALIGAGVSAAVVRLRTRGRVRWSYAIPVLAGLLVFLNLPALWTGGFYGDNLQRPEEIPRYWKQAAKALDTKRPNTRVLEVPGSDFGSYRWGQTVDPITPGLIDRPYVAREVIPYGSPASANLLNAFDLRLQDRKLTPDSISPLARLMGVGDITLRNDVQFERYRLLRPLFTWDLFTPTPSGLDGPRTFGRPGSTQSTEFPFLDEQAFLADPTLALPPPVAVFGVKQPVPIVRTISPRRPIVMAGDGEGMVDAAQAGMLDTQPLVQYSASFGKDPQALQAQVRRDATLVVTDSNRDRGRRWSTLTETAGFTEGPGTHPLTKDESDARLDLFPDAPRDSQTVTVLHGARSIRADSYGNAITYTPEDRPSRAFDGDPLTSWRAGEFDSVRGLRIRIGLDDPITTDHVNLVQILQPPNDRYITTAVMRFDGKDPTTITLGPSSRTAGGQTITFPKRRFRTFEVEVQDTNVGEQFIFGGLSPVGFGEIRLQSDAAGSAPVVVSEVVKMPGDLLRAAGAASASRPLVLLMNRDRVLPVPARHDPEPILARAFTLPTARGFSVAGDIRLSRDRDDAQIDRTLGYRGPVEARSSARLVNAPAVRASAALDHDLATAWVTPFRTAAGSRLDVGFGASRTL
ncbi:MAG: alpha-(1-_3)-arabinofuranosyltransferase family protein, partial [Acidimicrobiia bacterium]